MQDSHTHLSALTQVRTCMKGIHHEMKSTKWKKALTKKSLQKQLAQVCGLMSPYAYAPVLRKLIESKDPWLWLAGKDRKSTRLNSSHSQISYAVFCLKKKKLTN